MLALPCPYWLSEWFTLASELGENDSAAKKCIVDVGRKQAEECVGWVKGLHWRGRSFAGEGCQWRLFCPDRVGSGDLAINGPAPVLGFRKFLEKPLDK